MERRERDDEDDADDQSDEEGRRDNPGRHQRSQTPPRFAAQRERLRSQSAPPGTETPPPSSDENSPPAVALSSPSCFSDSGEDAAVTETCDSPPPPDDRGEGAMAALMQQLASGELMKTRYLGVYSFRDGRAEAMHWLPQDDQPVARVAEALNHVDLQGGGASAFVAQPEGAVQLQLPSTFSPNPGIPTVPLPRRFWVPVTDGSGAENVRRKLPTPSFFYEAGNSWGDQRRDEAFNRWREQGRDSPGPNPFTACVTHDPSTNLMRESSIWAPELVPLHLRNPPVAVIVPPDTFSQEEELPIDFPPQQGPPYEGPYLRVVSPSVLFRHSRPLQETPDPAQELQDSGQVSPPEALSYRGPPMLSDTAMESAGALDETPDPLRDQENRSLVSTEHLSVPATFVPVVTVNEEPSSSFYQTPGPSGDQENRSLISPQHLSVPATFVPAVTVYEEHSSSFCQTPGPSGDQQDRSTQLCVRQTSSPATFVPAVIVTDEPSSSYSQTPRPSREQQRRCVPLCIRHTCYPATFVPPGTVMEEPSSTLMQTPGPSYELPRLRSRHVPDGPSPRPPRTRQSVKTRGRPPRQPRNMGPGLCGPCPPQYRAIPAVPTMRPMAGVGGKRRQARNRGGHQANRNCAPSTSTSGTGRGCDCPVVVHVTTTRWFQKRGLRPWYGESGDQEDAAQGGRGRRGGRGRGQMHRPWLTPEGDQQQQQDDDNDDKAPDQGSP